MIRFNGRCKRDVHTGMQGSWGTREFERLDACQWSHPLWEKKWRNIQDVASEGISCKRCCQEHMSGGFCAATYGGHDRQEREFAESRKRKEIEESQQAPGHLWVSCQTIIGTWIRGNLVLNRIRTHGSKYLQVFPQVYLQVTCKDLDPQSALVTNYRYKSKS